MDSAEEEEEEEEGEEEEEDGVDREDDGTADAAEGSSNDAVKVTSKASDEQEVNSGSSEQGVCNALHKSNISMIYAQSYKVFYLNEKDILYLYSLFYLFGGLSFNVLVCFI